MHQMHEHAKFESNAKPDREPMQTPECRSDVIPSSDAGYESGGSILDTLQRIGCRLRKCCQNGVAVVHSGRYESRHQTRRDICTEDSPYGFEATKVEKACANDGADMVFHG